MLRSGEGFVYFLLVAWLLSWLLLMWVLSTSLVVHRGPVAILGPEGPVRSLHEARDLIGLEGQPDVNAMVLIHVWHVRTTLLLSPDLPGWRARSYGCQLMDVLVSLLKAKRARL